MARAASSDPFMNFRYQVVDPEGGHLDPVAGFTSITVPDLSLDPAEYREGIDFWTKKFPGIPTVGDLSLMQGVFRRRSFFYDWFQQAVGVENSAEYRTDLTVLLYHITDQKGVQGAPSLILLCKECFPTNAKPIPDLDATASEVSIKEITLAVEKIEVRQVAQPTN